MVVVDTLSKETHFIPVQSTYGTTQIANIFMKENFLTHGVNDIIRERFQIHLNLLEGIIWKLGY